MSLVVGIDIGNTKLAVGVVNTQGEVICQTRRPTDTNLSSQETVEILIDMVQEVIATSQAKDIKGIGIGFGGLVDLTSGVALISPNYPKWQPIDIRSIISEVFQLPVAIDNDANAGALAEKWYGAGVGVDNFAYLTVSTGCGGALVLDGKLYHGTFGYAGEIGHMTVDPNGPVCSCGRKGCLEAFVSGPSIARHTATLLENQLNINGPLAALGPSEITAKLVYDAAEMGDFLAMDIFARVGKYLGIGLSNLVNLLDLPLVVLGGGVMKASKYIFPTMFESLKQHMVREEELEVITSPLGDDVGIVGAAAVFLEQF